MPKTSALRQPKVRSISPERAQMAATFRLAAEVLDEVGLCDLRGCCYALTTAERRMAGLDGGYNGRYEREPIIHTLVALLAPPFGSDGWWYAYVRPLLDDVGTRNARIIGLLLCAHLIEDEAVPLSV